MGSEDVPVVAGALPDYDERLLAPPWVWVAALAVALIVAATLHAGAGGARAVVPYAIVLPGTLAALVSSSRGRVRISGGVLSVPGARIPLTALGGATPLDKEGTRRLRGPLAQPRAFLATRSWLTSSVRVQIEDPDDDTPYWLISTRRPQVLAEALRAAG